MGRREPGAGSDRGRVAIDRRGPPADRRRGGAGVPRRSSPPPSGGSRRALARDVARAPGLRAQTARRRRRQPAEFRARRAARGRDEARLESTRLGLRRAQEALGRARGGARSCRCRRRTRPRHVRKREIARSGGRRGPICNSRHAVQRAAERTLRDSWKDWWPTAGASFDPVFITPSGLFQPSRTWRLTLTFSQPVFEGGQRRAARALRQVTLDQSRLATSLLELQAESDIRVAQASFESAERTLASARQAAEHAAEVLRITTAAFEVGATTNLEVIDAQRSARDAATTRRVGRGCGTARQAGFTRGDWPLSEVTGRRAEARRYVHVLRRFLCAQLGHRLRLDLEPGTASPDPSRRRSRGEAPLRSGGARQKARLRLRRAFARAAWPSPSPRSAARARASARGAARSPRACARGRCRVRSADG